MASRDHLIFDHRGVASLDGLWDFFPGDHSLVELDALASKPIHVPGLWEAQGYLELDGTAWYRRRFLVERDSTQWTIRFGAVMDLAEVYVNGQYLGTHESSFTPFELDVGPVLRDGTNDIAVRVVDHPADGPEHIRHAHGKQGWANHVFPSRPSLYMTYGGIWQSVTLRRHGAVLISDVFVDSDPDRLGVVVSVSNRASSTTRGGLILRTLGAVQVVDVLLDAGESRQISASFDTDGAERWSPEHPRLHELTVDALVDGETSDQRTTRYGLRRITVRDNRIQVGAEPYRMKSVLVQGFRADTLYAEGTRRQIEEEVAAAKAMGFNTLRLHIKAFDPIYLDVCDELGMFVHSDIPVAEPIAHEELGGDTTVARRCAEAAREQVIRDRNHPSIILWSAMNELCLDRREARDWPGYETFTRMLVDEIRTADPTRPVIENDWDEPDPEGVHVSNVLTAHWYGRLHADYLETIERKCVESRSLDKPLFITEFGDWGLPAMPRIEEPPFWDTHDVYAAGLAQSQWPGTVEAFVTETQRYQGLSDRLQMEVFRRHDHIGGYCVTELTDVPHELNGLLDLHRQPKPIAVREVRRGNQTVLPILKLPGLVTRAGDVITAEVFVANDGPTLSDVIILARFGDSAGAVAAEHFLRIDASSLTGDQRLSRFDEAAGGTRVGSFPAHHAKRVGEISVVAPTLPGSHDLIVQAFDGSRPISENRYPIHVVDPTAPPAHCRLLGDGASAAALARVGVTRGTEGSFVVAEGALDARIHDEVMDALAAGENVLMLAQTPDGAALFPVPAEMTAVETKWGSSMFHFTTDDGAIPSLPRRTVLVTEDSTIHGPNVLTSIDGRAFPERPVVIAYKPAPMAMTATLIGAHPVGSGWLAFCQYRLADRAAAGDAVACAVLSDLLRWTNDPRPRTVRDQGVMADGVRNITLYSFSNGAPS